MTVFSAQGEENQRTYVGGVADAIAYDDSGRIEAVIDWKTDVDPSARQVELYREQIRDYLDATGAQRGLLVVVSSGRMVSVEGRAFRHSTAARGSVRHGDAARPSGEPAQALSGCIRGSAVRCSTRILTGMTKSDQTLAQIATQFAQHDVEKSGSGYMILDRRTSSPVARLRHIPGTDRFELFYWSNTKGRWTTFGNIGRLKLMIESAHEIVEN